MGPGLMLTGHQAAHTMVSAVNEARTAERHKPKARSQDMIEGVAGVVIWTGDLNRLVEFYTESLGLTPHSERPDFVAFKWGDMRLSIGKHSEIEGRTTDPYRIMVNLAVDNIHEVYRTLAARGVVFMRPPEREHWGGWVSTFADPDGNVLQLLQQPAG